jgi:pyridoxal phosphate enzyme (YggS family)
MQMIQERIARIRDNIAQICSKIGRNPADITLVGVTKFAENDKIQEAIRCGIRHIGENKVQEGERKFSGLDESAGKVTKHMIGHLQTNKVKLTLKYFDVIQSVDSLKLAKEISKEAGKINRVADIFVQINVAGEEQKFGINPAETLQLIRDITQLPNLKMIGIMTIAPLTENKNIVRATFKGLRELRDQAAKEFAGHPAVNFKYLSMGMTNDMEIALEEGSNMLRIGTAIFVA